jgi:BASS family bile acid:Na+ symporter
VLTQKIKKPIKTISILFFIALVVILLSANFSFFKKYIHLVILIVLIHNALAFGLGYLTSTVLKLPNRDRRSITIETGIQNSGLALALMFNPKIFSPDMALGGMTIIAAWWGIWHIVSGLVIATIWSKKKTGTDET